MKIWALFSVDNQYDQPENNLVAWWQKRPEVQVLVEAITGCDLATASHEGVISTVTVWKGARAKYNEATYRLEEIEEGKLK